MDIGILIFIIILIFLFSTILRSIFGFGDAVIAMPLLSFFIDLKVATPLFALAALTISIIILLFTYRKLHLKQVIRLMISTIIGIPIGIFILRETDENLIKPILGLIIILFSLYNLLKPNVIYIKNKLFTYLFGFIAGILGGAYNVNGPPIVFYASFKKWDPISFRATLQGYFFVTGILLVSSHMIVGNITYSVIQYYVFIVPVLLIGIFIGGKIHYKIEVEIFKKYVYLLMFFLGLFLMFTSLSQI